MGQKIEYNPEDWVSEEDTEWLTPQSEIILPSDFFSDIKSTPSLGRIEVTSEIKAESEITAFFNGEKIQIGRKNTDQLDLSPEEEAFRRQIEDLFELLELEKESARTDGVRVYQTDSSPSRPWRFH